MGKGPEAVACGLATHLIPSDQLVALRKDLEVGFGMLWIGREEFHIVVSPCKQHSNILVMNFIHHNLYVGYPIYCWIIFEVQSKQVQRSLNQSPFSSQLCNLCQFVTVYVSFHPEG